MRRAFVVLVLLAMMVRLKGLTADASAIVDPLTLAAIGFVVLAAFAVAELGSKASLPKVTGYIVSGVVLGPYASQVLSDAVVDEMAMFKQLALGLIALTAGVELDLKGLRSLAKTLSATIAIKIVFGFGLVGGVVVAGQMAFGVLDVEGTPAIVGVALVMAALSVGTSPSIALAIISENKAKGRLAEIVLGAAVVKDVVVVVLLAIAVAAAGALVGGGGISGSVLTDVAKHLGMEAGLGAVVGVLLIVYLRYVKAEMLLFVAAVVLVVGQIANALHLEVLLVFIVAGLVVRNFSSHEHDLLDPLETVSLPVFIVFFATAGAEVDLRATAAVLPLALAMCAARAAGFFVAGRVGGRFGGESEPVRNLAWLGYLPQAGVTLGLLALAAEQVPGLTGPITALGMAVVAVNLLVGPITLRLALHNAGEIPGNGAAGTSTAEGTVEEEEFTGAPWEAVESPELRAIVKEIADRQSSAFKNYVRQRIAPWIESRVQRLVEPLAGAEDRRASLTAIRDALEHVPADDAIDRVNGLLAFFGRQTSHLERLPAHVTVPLETRYRQPGPDDSFTHALRKRVARVLDALRFRFSNRTRGIPARAAARTVLEPRLARAIEDALRSWFRVEAHFLEELRRCALGTTQAEEAATAIRQTGQRFVGELDEELQLSVRRSARDLARVFDRVGSPILPASTVRYSKVEPELVAWRERLLSDAEDWIGRRDAGVRLVRVVNEVALIERHIRDLLGDQLLTVATEAFAAIDEESEAQQRRLAQAVEHAKAATALDDEVTSRLTMEVAALVPRPVQKRLRSIGGKLRRATSGSALGTMMREASIEQAGKETFVHSLAALIDTPRPARGKVITLDVSETIEAYVSTELAPKLEDLLSETWSAFTAAREAMNNTVSAAEFVLSSMQREGEDPPTPATVAEQLQRAGEGLPSATETAKVAWAELDGQIREALGGIEEHMVEEIARAAGRSTTKTQGRRRSIRGDRVRALYKRWVGPRVSRILELVGRFGGEAREGIGRHYRLRSGVDRADAADIRSYLKDAAATIDAELPAMYRALFAIDPVRDPRLFVAHRAALQEVVRVERAWQQDASTGNGALIVGASGTGKSSMIHVARLKLSTRRVVVVPERDRLEDISLLGFIARELGCTPDAASVGLALTRGRSAIVIDDLHSWIELGPEGVRSLDTLLSLIVSTGSAAFWLVAVADEWLEGLEPLIPVGAAFAQVVRLNKVDGETLGAVVDSRQVLSGLGVEYPLSWRARALGRLMGRPAKTTYLGQLASVARGNLRQAMRIWLRAASENREAKVIAMGPLGIGWGLPFLSQLSATQVGVLALLLRFGKRRTSELGEALALPAHHIVREVRFLTAAGLVQEHDAWIEIPVIVRDDVAAALAAFGAVHGAAA